VLDLDLDLDLDRVESGRVEGIGLASPTHENFSRPRWPDVTRPRRTRLRLYLGRGIDSMPLDR